MPAATSPATDRQSAHQSDRHWPWRQLRTQAPQVRGRPRPWRLRPPFRVVFALQPSPWLAFVA